ncbi:MAG: glycosyltransferase family A protein [Candidatus Omnitrophota bacterium]
MSFYQVEKVSILIVSREDVLNLAQTFNSVLHQTYKNVEIFLIVNTITEELSQFIEAYRDRIKLVIQQKGVSKGKILNNTLKLTEGKYFSILAAGDIWHPGVLEEKVKFLERNMTAFGVCCDFDIVDKNGLVNSSFFQMNDFFRGGKNQEAFVIEQGQRYLIMSRFKLFSTMLIRNQSYSFYGPFPEQAHGYEDIELLFNMAKHAQVGCINRVLVSRFFDAYKVSYYISRSVENRIASFEHLLNSLEDNEKKNEDCLKGQIENSYLFWAKYLIKNKEKYKARKVALDYLNKYRVVPQLLMIALMSWVPVIGNQDDKYDFFQMEKVKKDLLKLYY